jgi:hypothetical protein
MSASFDPKVNKNIGPFNMSHLTQKEISGLICKCDKKFMQKYQNTLEEPNIEMIEVKDYNITLFVGVVNDNILMLMNVLNLKRAKQQLLQKNDIDIINFNQLAQSLLSQYKFNINFNEDKSKLYCENDNELSIEEKQENETIKGNIIYNKKKYEILKKNLDELDEQNEIQYISETKMDKLSEICIKIKNISNSKWIFFSDDDLIFDQISPLLDLNDIKYVTLSEGTVQKNEIAIDNYKNNASIQIVFINSMRDGCGLNLENTTHILFLHKTKNALIEQVIGRAQRPGRSSRLNIIFLYHTNEINSNTCVLSD